MTLIKYETALNVTHRSDQNVMKLAWDVIGYEELIKQAGNLKVQAGEILEDVKIDLTVLATKSLGELKPRMLKYCKDMYTRRRTEATHLLAFMISDERHSQKPYAIPVWFL